MSIRVEFEGFVNGIREYSWGVAYDVAHSQRRKDPSGNWVTDGYDYFSVAGEPGFQVKDRVKVVGTLKTKIYDKKDGSGKGVALDVRAETITKIGAAPASVPDMQKIWPEVKQIPDTPF